MFMTSNAGMSSQDSGETHAPPDIEAGTQSNLFADSIRKKLSQRPNLSALWATSCIYRVPQGIRLVMEDAYTPKTVLIGPYHRVGRKGKEVTADLEAMENLKLEYVQAVLDRTAEKTSLDDYVNALTKLEAEARGCYSEPLNDLSPPQFVEIMLIDGLFIIELFRRKSDKEFDDPIFGSVMGASVLGDLVMLENQLPMSVLQTLFDLSKCAASPTLIDMALSYFKWLIPAATSKYTADKDNTNTHKHLVDLLTYTMCSSLPSDGESHTIPDLKPLPCVMKLHRSGVKFKRGSTSGCLMDIKFDKGKGELEIPPISIHDLTESFLRNLIAYEQCSFFTHTFYITSYALLMSYLINSADDVGILRRRGIIINDLGDDSKVSSLFSNLHTGTSRIDFSYYKLWKDVNDYYEKPYHKWKATFKRNYCNSPWSIVSVVVAPIIFFVTIWATVFSTLPVFNVTL